MGWLPAGHVARRHALTASPAHARCRLAEEGLAAFKRDWRYRSFLSFGLAEEVEAVLAVARRQQAAHEERGERMRELAERWAGVFVACPLASLTALALACCRLAPRPLPACAPACRLEGAGLDFFPHWTSPMFAG